MKFCSRSQNRCHESVVEVSISDPNCFSYCSSFSSKEWMESCWPINSSSSWITNLFDSEEKQRTTSSRWHHGHDLTMHCLWYGDVVWCDCGMEWLWCGDDGAVMMVNFWWFGVMFDTQINHMLHTTPRAPSNYHTAHTTRVQTTHRHTSHHTYHTTHTTTDHHTTPHTTTHHTLNHMWTPPSHHHAPDPCHTTPHHHMHTCTTPHHTTPSTTVPVSQKSPPDHNITTCAKPPNTNQPLSHTRQGKTFKISIQFLRQLLLQRELVF